MGESGDTIQEKREKGRQVIMGFKNNSFATLWNIDKNAQKLMEISEKYADIRISISKKNNKDEYETDFSGRVRCLGKAFEKIKELSLKEKDKIKLIEVETTAKYVKEKQQSYTNFLCWDLEIIDPESKPPRQPDIVDNPELTPFDPIDDDRLPF